ncbi:hypothetical protein [Haloarcula montana]|uniref:hypothetical protein n=1 Tax=Haloarcula montana TaxID=3111776 RepID=UPI002D7711D3|nr:hypothetical protein [Haloarcula sp. GH36]
MTDQNTRLNDGSDLQIAQPEDFGVHRDDNGDLVPQKQRIPGTDLAIKVKPLVGGAAERYEDVLESDRADDERVEEFFDEFIAEGVGSAGDLDNVPDYLVSGLIKAIKNSSGFGSHQAVQQQEMEENAAAMQAVGASPEELVDQAMEFANDEDADTR